MPCLCNVQEDYDKIARNERLYTRRGVANVGWIFGGPFTKTELPHKQYTADAKYDEPLLLTCKLVIKARARIIGREVYCVIWLPEVTRQRLAPLLKFVRDNRSCTS